VITNRKSLINIFAEENLDIYVSQFRKNRLGTRKFERLGKIKFRIEIDYLRGLNFQNIFETNE